MYFSVFYGIYLFFFPYSADNEERLSLSTTSDDAFFSILLFFVGIFQYFSEFSVLFSISRYFLVFLRIFQYFRYFSVFFVFFQYFRYFLVIFSIRQIKRISCHFQQPVMMLRKTFSKKKEEDYCIVKLLHEYPSLFLIFQISETRSIKCPCPVNFTASLCYMSCPLGKLCTCQNKNTKGQWCSLSRYFEMFEIAALWIQASWMQALLKKYEIVPSGHNDGSRKPSLSRDCDAWAALHWRQPNALYLMFRCDISWRIRIEDSPIHFFWCSYLRQVAKYLLSTLLTTSNV